MNLRLVLPDINYKEQILSYKDEFAGNQENMDGTAGLEGAKDFEEWYANVCNNLSEETVQQGLVPATALLAIDENNRLVGMVDIRHRLNDYLYHFGGHIGYSVRKTERGKGYGTQILSLALRECESLGIERILVTCDIENIASKKIIQKNGGILENTEEHGKTIIERYWIKG